MQQATFERLAFAAKQKLTRSEKFLTERATVVPWAALEAVIEPHYPKARRRGGQSKPLGAMLRIYFMQQWHSRLACRLAMYFGDDDTDEDVFALKRPNQILGIRVGHSERSAVECFVCDQQEIDRLLERLLELADPSHPG